MNTYTEFEEAINSWWLRNYNKEYIGLECRQGNLDRSIIIVRCWLKKSIPYYSRDNNNIENECLLDYLDYYEEYIKCVKELARFIAYELKASHIFKTVYSEDWRFIVNL